MRPRPDVAPHWTPAFVADATATLRAADPVLGRLIDRIGPCVLTPDADHFPLLVKIVISQQISTKAARSVSERLRKSLPARRFTPAGLARLSVDEIRAAGLTRARAAFIKGLAEAVAGRTLRVSDLAAANDDELLTALTAVRGFGRWSVEMLQIFGLGRPDVFPANDLGVRKSIAALYGREPLPTPASCRAVAEAWRPYRTFATWYLWRASPTLAAECDLARYPL